MKIKILIFLFLMWLMPGAGGAGAVEDPTNFNMRVLFVELNPVEDGQDMIQRFFGYEFPGKTTDQALEVGIGANINAFKRLSNNKINYEVVKKIEISTFPKYTNGYVYNFSKYTNCASGDPGKVCEKQKFYFDYIDWARSNNICRLAAENNIDEIWMAAPPYITTYENFMIGPRDGFEVNGGVFTLPECIKNYVVMSSGWTTDSFAHIYGHRIERTMGYIVLNWRADDRNRYWENFIEMKLYAPWPGGIFPVTGAYCGNSHFPHNATAGYNYANKTYKASTCGDWKNIPNFTGTRESINCDRWGCGDNRPAGWGEYWLGSIPREQGGINLVSNNGSSFYMKNNWWYYFLYPENVNDLVNETYGTATANCQPGAWTQTASPSTLNWLALGSYGNTGYVNGPAVPVTCPDGQKFTNTGTFCSRRDGKKKFYGITSNCFGDGPTPTPTPACQPGSWTQGAGGQSIRNWFALGSSGDTGYIDGPTVWVACPSGQTFTNTGTYCSRWDGKKRFYGSTSLCNGPTPPPIVGGGSTPSATPSPTLRPTNTPIARTCRGGCYGSGANCKTNCGGVACTKLSTSQTLTQCGWKDLTAYRCCN
ncbi:MAG: hypothetical protein WC841_04205 [Candidatus Shapirobacteria bacterium]|jgi:hypothetical protein